MPMAEVQQLNGHHNGPEQRPKIGPLKRPSENEFMHTHVKHTINSMYTFETLEESARYLLERTSIRPKIGIICGSGMSSIADHLAHKRSFPYEEIPHFPVSTVKGHVGQMVFGHFHGIPVMAMQGRFHYYEGYPLWKCAMPVRVMKLCGITHLMVSNAAGGLNPGYKVGDIMLMKDHVNMMGFAGNNPLQGPNDDRFGPRFVPMTDAYNRDLIALANEVVEDMGIKELVHKGVYTCLGGPNYETVAEMKLLRLLGVDAIGMSTVHEVITAHHCNIKIIAFSLITNLCIPEYESGHGEANHEEVVQVGKEREPMIREFVGKIVSRLATTIENDENVENVESVIKNGVSP